MGLGPTKTGAFTALVPCLPMFFSTWETYHTHTLYLGAFNGPTEGLLIAAGLMIFSGYFGPQIWTFRVADVVGYKEIFSDLCFRDLWPPIILATFFVAHLPACIYHVIVARRAAGLPVSPVFLDWFPMLMFTGSCVSWLGSPYSSLLTNNRLVLFCLTMSFVFGRLTTKIILHHLTRQPFPYWTVLLVPLVGGAVLGNLPRFGFSQVSPILEGWYLRIYFVFAMIAYFRWATVVINKICVFLDINCFTIKNRKVDRTRSKPSENSRQQSNGKVLQTKKRV